MAENSEEEQTHKNDQDQEEFSSVVIPILTVFTNAYQESQVDRHFRVHYRLKPKHIWKACIRQQILSLLKTNLLFYRISELD